MCLASPGQIVEFVEGRPRPHSRSAFPIDIVRRENSQHATRDKRERATLAMEKAASLVQLE
ncbi:MAG: hypothetical protein ACR2GK_11620 [Gemmatimonadaceae bacterium]